MRVLRDQVPLEQRMAWSNHIFERVINLPEYRAARFMHCFLSIQSEVDTRPIIQHALDHDKRVALPIFSKGSSATQCTEIVTLNDAEFKTSADAFGLQLPTTLRPVALSNIDLIFVPLLAFAKVLEHPHQLVLHNFKVGAHRLGYGAGYYDRVLAQIQVPKIGLGFAMQEIDLLPVEPHDMPLDVVITEKV
jgi:5-formyltetrahydrofolate cyclo-ligase